MISIIPQNPNLLLLPCSNECGKIYHKILSFYKPSHAKIYKVIAKKVPRVEAEE